MIKTVFVLNPKKKGKTMNTTTLKLTITAALLFAGHIGMAENPADATAQENAAKTQDSIQELAELGPGVHRVKKTANNVFKSCVVVGQARISTVLGKSKGLATARAMQNSRRNQNLFLGSKQIRQVSVLQEMRQNSHSRVKEHPLRSQESQLRRVLRLSHHVLKGLFAGSHS